MNNNISSGIKRGNIICTIGPQSITNSILVKVDKIHKYKGSPYKVEGKAIYPKTEDGNRFVWHITLIRVLSDLEYSQLLEK